MLPGWISRAYFSKGREWRGGEREGTGGREGREGVGEEREGMSGFFP